jgi:hypothetical protein
MYQQFNMSNYKSSVLYRLSYITFDGTYVYMDGVMSVKHMLNFSLSMRKSNETKVAEEYCSTMTKTVGQSWCSLSGSNILEFRFQLDSAAYTYTVKHIHTQF